VESVLFRVKVRAVGRAARPREADALPRLCGVRVLVPSVLPAIGFSSCDQLEACGPGRAWEARLPKQTLGLQGRGIPPGEAKAGLRDLRELCGEKLCRSEVVSVATPCASVVKRRGAFSAGSASPR
jgi:hypothetical protein